MVTLDGTPIPSETDPVFVSPVGPIAGAPLIQTAQLNQIIQELQGLRQNMRPTLLIGESGQLVKVTVNGELVMAPLDYSDPIFQDMDLVNTAYNFFTPKPNRRFVITDIIAFGDRDVGVNGAVLEIYEATAVDSTTIDKQILRLEIAKSTESPHHGLRLLVNEGRWLNAKHDDDDIFMTIAGYYILT